MKLKLSPKSISNNNHQQARQKTCASRNIGFKAASRTTHGVARQLMYG